MLNWFDNRKSEVSQFIQCISILDQAQSLAVVRLTVLAILPVQYRIGILYPNVFRNLQDKIYRPAHLDRPLNSHEGHTHILYDPRKNGDSETKP
jgi:hypothetical protein